MRVAEVVGSSRVALWLVFIAVHLGYGVINLYSPSNPLGDVRDVYSFWVNEALSAHYWVAIDGPWVYPVLALVPMFLARVFGSELYPNTWLSLVFLLDVVGMGVLTGWGRRSRNLRAGWWWAVFLALLGPIAFGRIDSITVPVALVGLLLIVRHPRLATALLTVAAWIKVWPVAILASLVVAVRHRGQVLAAAITTSAVIVIIAVTFGSGWNVLSFITEQTGRGLQIEAPVSTIWLWRAVAGVPGTFVYYDRDILTFQVTGRGTDEAAALMNPILLVAVAVVVLLGVRAVRRGRQAVELVAMLSLALVATLIVFNKVGSPQYITWLAVPVIAGIAAGGAARETMRLPAALVLLVAGLTQAVYPYLYDELVGEQAWMVAVITVRNLLLVAVFVVSLVELTVLGRRSSLTRAAPEHDPLAFALAEKDRPA